MIPKVLHYVWFGKGEKSPLIKRCIKSWKKVMPDYEIVEWNEDNFDTNMNTYCRQALEVKKYAFAADYARLWILYNCGGIYMDTDVEAVKKFDDFLSCEAFSAFENDTLWGTGVIGAEKGNKIIKYLLDYYEDREFYDPNQPSGIDWTPNTSSLTDLLVKKGLKLIDSYQEIEGLTVYPSAYFCQDGSRDDPNKYAIHYFVATWLPEEIQKKNAKHRKKAVIKKKIKKIIGVELYEKLKSLKK